MRILGLEGTAWAASAAVFDTETERVTMHTEAYRPDSGGIHPREAAEHMADALPRAIAEVRERAPAPVDAMAFSQGPGLGPCLRIVATAARTAAMNLDVPLVGVNHMVAHLEVGRRLSGFDDPICLNASGANAHVLGFRGGRYRVLGETMDTGVGNAIDKFTRHVGWSHPGGPKVEAHAVDGEYLDLPYVVKGMDFSFSGIMSAAKAAYDDGVAIEDICCGLQETIFAMLTEVSERALSLTGREQLVVGGGVAQNSRLREMLFQMCEDRDVAFFTPEDRFLRDNAAMIAMLGAEMAASGQTLAVSESTIRPDYRPNQVEVTWREPLEDPPSTAFNDVDRGAEAIVTVEGDYVVKTRIRKEYRHPTLDERLRRERTATEARLTSLARRAGVPTPVIRDIDLPAARLTVTFVGDADLRDALTAGRARRVGAHLASLHGAGIVHGDPTTRNVRVTPTNGENGRVYLIDFGLGFHSGHVEDRAMDVHVFQQSVSGTAADPGPIRHAVEQGYRDRAPDVDVEADAVFDRLSAIESRGRYR